MNLKVLSLAALSAMALMASTASSAMATTLEEGGVAKNASVSIEATIAAGGSLQVASTTNVPGNTCTSSSINMHTEGQFTGGATVSGPITALAWNGCTEGNPVVDTKGSLFIEHIFGTTNGTVSWSGAKITMASFFGPLTCTTNNTDIGTISGVAAGKATLTINGVINCGALPSAKWTGTYTITGPAGLGVTA